MSKAATTGLGWDDITREALELPGVEESTSYGTPALKVRDKLMVRLKEDLGTVVLRTTWDDRERLMTLYPVAFHVTDHYRAHPWVLLRMDKAPRTHLAKWLLGAWRLAAPKSLAKKHLAEGKVQ